MNIIAAIVRTFGPGYVRNMSNPFGVGSFRKEARSKPKAKTKPQRKRLRHR